MDVKEKDLQIVTELIADQFPQFSHLPIREVELGGLHHFTFHLGDEMSIRIPVSREVSAQIQKEKKWLPRLSPHLSLSISEPLFQGEPSRECSLRWGIYRWLEGKSANLLPGESLDLKIIALQLAQFLKELHKINITGGPLAGVHNDHRGAHPSIYSYEARSAISDVRDVIDPKAATAVWEKAICSQAGVALPCGFMGILSMKISLFKKVV
ncbi:MAG: aminoglycoside phosphotransferase [bacterium]|nr:aminoglycoside phosphotransferase [bacterium]